MLAEHVGDGQDHIGGGNALRDGAGELEADHARHEHGDRLAEHGGLGFNAADAPAEHAQTVFGGGVRVGAHAGVEVGERVAVGLGLAHDHLGQVFDVDLVDNAGSRRHHAEVLECLLTPAQELVAFAVALVLDVHVLLDRVGDAVLVDLHGVVDDHVGLDLRVDDLRVAAVDVAHQILDQYLQRVRQMIDAVEIGDVVVIEVLAGCLEGSQLVVA